MIRIGVIGCGRMGSRRASGVIEHENSELVAVADESSEFATKSADEFGVKALTPEQLLSSSEIDCVVLSTPNQSHMKLAQQAADAGKHLFVEKPLAGSVSDAQSIVEAVERNGVLSKTGSNLRYFPNVLKAKSLVDTGVLGRLTFLRAWIGHEGWNLENQWFSDPTISGGGTFLDNGCHVLDIARWFAGEAVSCTGMVSTMRQNIEPLEDNGVGIFRMQNDALVTIHSSWTEWNGYMYLELYGENGYIQVDCRGRSSTTTLGDTKGGKELFDYSNLPPTSYGLEWDDFVQHLLRGEQPSPSSFDGYRAVKMAHSVYDSAKAGREVSLAE